MSKSEDSVDDDSYYSMGRRALITGNHMCILKATQLADSALRLSNSDNPDDHTIALGLYTLAIEEFGKAVILKEECFVDNDTTPQKVRKSIFAGNRAHQIKFKKAMNKLPPECTAFMVGTYVPFASGEAMTKRIGKKGPEVSVPSGVSGNFFAKYTADVHMRMSSFFVDWNEENGGWIFHMKVERREERQTALTKFKEEIKEYDLVVMIQKRQEQQGGSIFNLHW
jgi:AbiV family abortive infection protein